MSTATPMSLSYATEVANRFAERIAAYCERLEIAGSIRRRSRSPRDIEIVAVPRIEPQTETDMFGEVVATSHVDLLDACLVRLLGEDVISKRLRSDGQTFWGPKAKYLTFEGVNVDLFTPSRERFGVVLVIRTGPAAYSHQLVTERGKTVTVGFHENGRPIQRVGLLPPIYRVQEGWLTYRVSGQKIETPTEEGVFELLGLPYVEPEHRR